MEDAEPPLFYSEDSKVCNIFKDRYCKYCGVYMDTTDIEVLRFVHLTCWQIFRMNGELYPMPKHADKS